MKTLGTSLLLTVALGLAVAAGALVLGLEASVRAAALVGAGVSTAVGALALVIKTASPVSGGTKGLQALLSRQVVSLFLRLGTVGLGAAALQLNGAGSSAALAFVVTFFIAYLGQQVVEVRSLLAVRQSAAKPEVTP
ncbi:MAG: hypothetical protein AMXMBFR34_03220 [Myxococcaceae bacterium]